LNCLIATEPELAEPVLSGPAALDLLANPVPEPARRDESSAGPIKGERFQVFSRATDIDPEVWRAAFGDDQKDFEYYRLIEETLASDFAFRYMLLTNETDQPIALQPLILVDQDLAATATAQSILAHVVRGIRRFWPRFLRTRMLMAGCLVGESKLGLIPPTSHDKASEILAEALVRYGRQEKIRLIAAKDFSANARELFTPLVKAGYTHLEGFPSLILHLNFDSFDEYLRTHLSKITRKGLRRKLRKSDKTCPPIQLEVLEDCSGVVDEIYPLYLQVTERSDVNFEVFTKEYFLEAGRRMPGRFRYFVWRRAGKAIAFSFCTIWGDTLYDNDIGLDYEVAYDLNLYYVTFRDLIEWALRRGLKYYCSAPFNYDPKLRLGLNLVDLDLYVRHTSRLINAVLRVVAPHFSPAKSDPVLQKHASRAKKDRCEPASLNGSSGCAIPGSKSPSAQALSPSRKFS
jgi:Acetyltransferase (GNAT) domain